MNICVLHKYFVYLHICMFYILFVSSSNSYIEALIPQVMVLKMGTLGAEHLQMRP